MGNCLALHSCLGGADESSFIRYLARIFNGFFEGHNRRSWAPLREYANEEEVLEALRSCANGICMPLLARLAKPRYIDHTPWYVKSMLFIRKLYPDAQFVHIIRDGRDVVKSLGASYEAGYLWAGDSVANRTKLWNESVTSGRLAGLALDTSHYLEVRYEDLCEDPTEILSRTLKFLDLEMEESVLLPLAHPHAAPSRPNARLAHIDEGSKRLTILPKNVAKKWPDCWTNRDKEDFLGVAGNLLEVLGYLDH